MVDRDYDNPAVYIANLEAENQLLRDCICEYVLSHREDIIAEINDFGELKPVLQALEVSDD